MGYTGYGKAFHSVGNPSHHKRGGTLWPTNSPYTPYTRSEKRQLDVFCKTHACKKENLIIPIFAPRSIRTAHPTTIKVYILVLAIKERVCKLRFLPVTSRSCLAINYRHQVI